jgi:uncharacterized glyoxalase superfamily protein PhnB
MKFLALAPMLQTNNMESTIQWYQSVLGFSIEAQSDDKSWCSLTRDDAALMLSHEDHPATANDAVTLYIYTDDAAGLWNSIKDRCKAEWGPEQAPYGMLEFAIKDPNGYLICFGQEVE